MRDKIKITNDAGMSINVALSMVINVILFALIVFITLFTTEFNLDYLFPHYEVYIDGGIMGQIVENGDRVLIDGHWYKPYYTPGVLIITGIIQAIGTLLYFNIFWSHGLKLSNNSEYVYHTSLINKFTYLISNKEFRKHIKKIDRDGKIETWKTVKSIELQNHYRKLKLDMVIELDDLSEWVEDSGVSKPILSDRTKEWKIKEEKIEKLLDDEWIEKNIDKQKLKYPRIDTSMVVHGNDKVKISSTAIENLREVKRKQILNKFIFIMLTFAFVSFFGTIQLPSFKHDVWNTIKDFVMYSGALVSNYYMGIRSASYLYNSKIKNLQDRMSYIENFEPIDKVNNIKQEIFDKLKNDKQEEIQQKLEILNK